MKISELTSRKSCIMDESFDRLPTEYKEIISLMYGGNPDVEDLLAQSKDTSRLWMSGSPNAPSLLYIVQSLKHIVEICDKTLYVFDLDGVENSAEFKQYYSTLGVVKNIAQAEVKQLSQPDPDFQWLSMKW